MKRQYRLDELIYHDESVYVEQFPDNNMPGSMQEVYFRNHTAIDFTIKNKYGHLKTLRKYDSVESAFNDMQNVFDRMMAYNRYKYTTLSNTEHFEYEPLWNVDGTVETETERESTDTMVNGQIQTTVNNGQKVVSSTIGQRTNTDTIGASTLNRVNAVSPFETESIANVAHDEQIETTAQKQDTHILSGATDSQTQNASTDTSTISSHTDTNSNEVTEKVKTVRYGNIGVTSTQNLIQQERDIAYFNVFEIVFNDFFDIFCDQIID